MDLEGKRVLVTGATSGLGREIARRLARAEGAWIVAAGRRRERLEELKAELEAGGGPRVQAVTVDLAAPGAADALHRDALAGGEVFGLVSCAGVTHYGPALEAPAGTAERILAVNYSAPARLLELFLPGFLARGSGVVLTVTSVAGLVPIPWQAAYSASKHALQAWAEALAAEYRGRGVVFSTFVPGGMDTEMLAATGKYGSDSPVNMDAAVAARIAVEAMKRGTARAVPGAMYKAAAIAVRVVPRALVARAVAAIYRPQESRTPTTGL